MQAEDPLFENAVFVEPLAHGRGKESADRCQHQNNNPSEPQIRYHHQWLNAQHLSKKKHDVIGLKKIKHLSSFNGIYGISLCPPEKLDLY